ncbi:AraC family transcriptional regulator [uncultured Oscillibacter sp.]|uniref:AraC family transcriptional regulator n=1 Tax=uncultured Oscillibacter sp. TaxID=876091 RepID=UPI0025F55C31|nr:AraC family transcriptional regulator [uncultured Oscillibacter sp.]
MDVHHEPGVLPGSQRYFATPSALARRLFFYVTRCGRYQYDGRFSFRDDCSVARLESHRNFFMLYLTQGRMRFSVPGGPFTLRAGQLALVDCRAPHAFDAEGSAASVWLHFDGPLARPFYQEILSLRDGRQALDLPPQSPVVRELEAVVDSVAAGNGSEADRSERLYRILCALLFPSPACRDDPVTAAMAYVQAHLAQPVSVPELAAAVGLSASHFSRRFRAATGLSPHEYLVLRRIDAAKQLLLSTELPLRDIAARTGYHSEVNFIVSFTEKTGLSPTAFRRGS